MRSEDGVVGREMVIRVLTENGVSVTPQKNTDLGNLVLAKNGTLEVRKFEDEVGRKLVRALSMKFEIPIHFFYA